MVFSRYYYEFQVFQQFGHDDMCDMSVYFHLASNRTAHLLAQLDLDLDLNLDLDFVIVPIVLIGPIGLMGGLAEWAWIGAWSWA